MVSENISDDQLKKLIDVAKDYGSVENMLKESVNNTGLQRDAKSVLDMAIFLQLYLKAKKNNNTEFEQDCIKKFNECVDKLNA